MDGQLHITHRAYYLRGRLAGIYDASHGESYQRNPTDTDAQRAYALGYIDGWTEVSES